MEARPWCGSGPMCSASATADAIRALPPVAIVEAEEDLLVIGALPGYRYATQGSMGRGFHGGPSTASTLAIVAGGHPAVGALAERIRCTPPHLADWAGVIAGVLGVKDFTAQV